MRMLRVRTPSRETRLLAATIAVSVLVLLVLGRFRFPDGPEVGVEPVQSQPLARLASRAAFDDLSLAIGQLASRVGPSLVVLRVSPPATTLADGAVPAALFVPGIRVRDDVAVAHLPEGARVEGIVGAPGAGTVVGHDPIRELALVRIPSQPAQVLAVREGAAPLPAPGYVSVASATQAGISIQPVFVGRSDTQADPRWDAPLLTLGPAVRVEDGAPVFTLDGRLAGLTTVSPEGESLLVPSDTMMAAVEQIFAGAISAMGDIGIETQRLDARTSRATGARSGAIISDIREGGPADGPLWIGDVVTAVDGRPIASPEALQLRIRRAAPGGSLSLTVLRGGSYQSVPVQVHARDAVTVSASAADTLGDLGVTLRAVPSQGAQVVRVRDGSPADVAGIVPGDLVRAVGARRAPTPTQVDTAWNGLDAGATLFLGIARDGRTRAVAVIK